ncbi:MAG: TauD/TfdA family dioxygenase [Actinomycetota bacterium]|nr:TauD/TfdA family dioxygenase [Actinomycetota bacterium]
MRVELLPGTGALVTGVDLRRDPDLSGKAQLQRLYRDRHLLVFRDQDLTDERHVEVAGWFGPVRVTDRGAIAYVSNVRPDGLVPEGPLPFHSDMSFTESPLLGISLHAMEVPRSGASTLFANAEAAAAGLGPTLAGHLAGRSVRNIAGYGEGFRGRRKEADCDPHEPRFDHPAMGPHPVTGQMVLRINGLSSSHLVGLDYQESDRILEEVFAVLYGQENVYEHHWRVGDLVVFDNIAVHHARRDFDSAERRTLRRVVLDVRPPMEVDPEVAALYRQATAGSS